VAFGEVFFRVVVISRQLTLKNGGHSFFNVATETDIPQPNSYSALSKSKLKLFLRIDATYADSN
jgi:hypothetical protein